MERVDKEFEGECRMKIFLIAFSILLIVGTCYARDSWYEAAEASGIYYDTPSISREVPIQEDRTIDAYSAEYKISPVTQAALYQVKSEGRSTLRECISITSGLEKNLTMGGIQR
jgi:hypothetical protein